MIQFTVPGEPTGKGRPRFTRSGRCYTPKKTQDYENQVALAYKMLCDAPRTPVNTPVMLEIDVYHSLPKSLSKRRTDALRNEYPQKTPDLDNCIKAVTDGLNKIAYEDDKQIVAIIARKYYADVGRVEVRIGTL